MMRVNRPTDRQVIQQALEILLTHMDPSNVARFVAVCQLGEGDYLKTKDRIFAGETVDSLYEKIEAFEDCRNQEKS